MDGTGPVYELRGWWENKAAIKWGRVYCVHEMSPYECPLTVFATLEIEIFWKLQVHELWRYSEMAEAMEFIYW